MKYNMHYRRFRHFGKDKVTMDVAFFAIACNIKKTAAKAKKQGDMPIKGGHNVPSVTFYMLIGDLQRHYKTEIRKIAA